MPKTGFWSAYFSATSTQAARVFVGCGVKSVSCTSQSTRMFSPLRMGSGHSKTGCRTQSELLPGAWLVLEPSKPQMPGSSPSLRIFVLLRINGVGFVPSIQMYSAW